MSLDSLLQERGTSFSDLKDFRNNGAILSKNYKMLVLISVTIARAVYAMNWYTLSPGLSLVAKTFDVSTANLGILESTFLVGAGLFQIPSTIGSSKWGFKPFVVGGLLLIGITNVLGGLAETFSELVVLRFFLGIGASMFFAPAIGVVGRLFQNEKQGLAIGLYNSAFNVGGVVALFGWSYVISFLGWRGGLILGAILAIALGIENQIVIRYSEREEEKAPGRPSPIQSATTVLKNGQVWLLGIGILGVWAAVYVIAQFLPYFEETVNGVSSTTASLLGAQIFLWSVPASIIGGYLSDRFRNRRYFMLFPSIALGVLTAIIGVANLNESWLILFSIGVTDAFAFTALYASVYQMPELRVDQKIIAIALMNAVQISSSFFAPILFSYLATRSYFLAWLGTGLFVLPFCIALLIAKEPFKQAIAKGSQLLRPDGDKN
jgi:predicted MFS family arabinose efflux permease